MKWDVVLFSINTVLTGLLAWFLVDLIKQIRTRLDKQDADARLNHEEVMNALKDYVEREPHMEKHDVLDTRVNDHGVRLRRLEQDVAEIRTELRNRSH